MPKLGVSEHENCEKRGLKKFVLTIFGVLHKKSPQNLWSMHYEILLKPTLWLIAKKKLWLNICDKEHSTFRVTKSSL